MKRAVIDCSAAISWFFPEEGSTRSLPLLKELYNRTLACMAPALLPAEFGNVALKKALRSLCSFDQAQRQVDYFSILEIRYVDCRALLAPAFVLARDHSLTVYDALYLALAISQKVSIATFDQKLSDAARSNGIQILPV